MKKTLIFLFILMFSFLFLNVKAEETKLYYDVGSLPITKDNLNLNKNEKDLDIGTVDFIFLEQENLYDITINYKERQYKLKNKIPVQEKIGNITKGFYFTVKINNKYDRYIYFEFESRENTSTLDNGFFDESIKYNLHKNLLNPFQSKVIWNISNGNYKLNDKLEIFATPMLFDGVYYLDFVLNRYVDRILAVDLEFSYTRKYWWGLRNYHYRDAVTFLYNQYYLKNKNYLPFFINEDEATEYVNNYLEKLNNVYGGLSLDERKEKLEAEKFKITSKLKTAITYIDNKGVRQSLDDTSFKNIQNENKENTMRVSSEYADNFTKKFNENLKNTYEYMQKNNEGIEENSIIGKYAAKVKKGLIGYRKEEIFLNSGNKIFSVPLISDSGNYAYFSTDIESVKFINIAYELDGKTYVVYEKDINTNFAPNKTDTPGESFKRGAKSAFSKIGLFFSNLWKGYKTFVIISLVIVGVVVIGLIILIIVKPEVLKLLKYLI